MAIIIPSKHIYEKQNQKAIDNVIERIELSENEPSLKKQYETQIHEEKTESFSTVNKTDYYALDKNYAEYDNGITAYLGIGFSYCSYTKFRYTTPKTFRFRVLNEGVLTTKYYYGEKGVHYTIYGTSKSRAVICPFSGNLSISYGGDVKNYTIDLDFANATYGTWFNNTNGALTLSEEYTKSQEQIRIKGVLVDCKTSATKSVKIKDTVNDAKLYTEVVDGETYIVAELGEILSGYTTIQLNGQADNLTIITVGHDFSGEASGVELELNPERIEFVFNGDTISLDLKEKTAYINGETSKKVHSFDGNELMQTSNTYTDSLLGTSVNAIEKMYGETQRQYANGKETATIECSISDYDGNLFGNVTKINNLTYKNNAFISEGVKIKALTFQTANIENAGGYNLSSTIPINEEGHFSYTFTKTEKNGEGDFDVLIFRMAYSGSSNLRRIFYDVSHLTNGETYTVEFDILKNTENYFVIGNIYIWGKGISVDNSTNKMTFEIGDEVIPMVYVGNGEDRPMSKYNNGADKIFEVVGIKTKYEGVPRQILDLQETTT